MPEQLTNATANAPKIAGRLAIIASIAPLNASPNELIIDTKLSIICGANSATIAAIYGRVDAITEARPETEEINLGAIL